MLFKSRYYETCVRVSSCMLTVGVIRLALAQKHNHRLHLRCFTLPPLRPNLEPCDTIRVVRSSATVIITIAVLLRYR